MPLQVDYACSLVFEPSSQSLFTGKLFLLIYRSDQRHLATSAFNAFCPATHACTRRDPIFVAPLTLFALLGHGVSLGIKGFGWEDITIAYTFHSFIHLLISLMGGGRLLRGEEQSKRTGPAYSCPDPQSIKQSISLHPIGKRLRSPRLRKLNVTLASPLSKLHLVWRDSHLFCRQLRDQHIDFVATSRGVYYSSKLPVWNPIYFWVPSVMPGVYSFDWPASKERKWLDRHHFSMRICTPS